MEREREEEQESAAGEGSDRRARIVDAAFVEFAAKGFRGATIKSIARAARLQSSALIYWYFPTKEALFEAVVVNHMLHLADRARDLAESERPTQALFEFIGQRATEAAAKRNGFTMEQPFRSLTPEQQAIVFTGDKNGPVTVQYKNQYGRSHTYDTTFEGVVPNLDRRYKETDSDYVRGEIERPLIDGEQGAAVLAIALAGLRSSSTGRAVDLEQEGEPIATWLTSLGR